MFGLCFFSVSEVTKSCGRIPVNFCDVGCLTSITRKPQDYFGSNPDLAIFNRLQWTFFTIAR